MRIDVEVYKGPLSEEPEVQWSNLWGLLEQTEQGLIETDNIVRAAFASKGFWGLRHDPPHPWPLPRLTKVESPGGDEITLTDDTRKVGRICYQVQAESPWYEMKFWRLFGYFDDIDHQDCLDLVTLIRDLNHAIDRVVTLKQTYACLRSYQSPCPEIVPAFLAEITELSSELKFQAFRWSIATGAGASLNRMVRIAHVHAIVATSEYATELNARADALLKQLSSTATALDRREMSPGVALRQTEPTDFVRLYEWLNANPGIVAQTLAGIGSTADRVKVIETLFADHFWAKTNTVYASGRGNVAMAFIKDDVGNWNLKSFDNAPGELLKAYTDFSITALKTATKIAADATASGVGGGAPAVARLITLATETAFGKSASDAASTSHDSLLVWRRSLVRQLKEKAEQCQKTKEDDAHAIEQCVKDFADLIRAHGNLVDGLARDLLSANQGK